jgi:hypothetical protein
MSEIEPATLRHDLTHLVTVIREKHPTLEEASGVRPQSLKASRGDREEGFGTDKTAPQESGQRVAGTRRVSEGTTRFVQRRASP